MDWTLLQAMYLWLLGVHLLYRPPPTPSLPVVLELGSRGAAVPEASWTHLFVGLCLQISLRG